MGLERAEIGVGRIHQRRDLAHPVGEILRPVLADVEIRIAREDVLEGAGAEHPGDAVVGRGGSSGGAGAEPPRAPAAGRAIGGGRLAGHTPARIFGDAVGEREREAYGDCSVWIAATCASLRQSSPPAPAAQSSFAGSNCALQPTASSTRASAMPSCASQAASTASCTSLTCAGRIQPSPMVTSPARALACRRPVQLITGTRAKMPSKSSG